MGRHPRDHAPHDEKDVVFTLGTQMTKDPARTAHGRGGLTVTGRGLRVPQSSTSLPLHTLLSREGHKGPFIIPSLPTPLPPSTHAGVKYEPAATGKAASSETRQPVGYW